MDGDEGDRGLTHPRRALASVLLSLLSVAAIAAPALAATKYFSGGGCTVRVRAEESWGDPYGQNMDWNDACGHLKIEMRYN